MASDSTGHAPPPKPPEVNWRAALRSSFVVAAIGAALFAIASYVPALTVFSLLWILGAGSIGIGFYRFREPALRMDASIGARIGLSVGLLLTAALSVVLAGIGFLARFRFHSMTEFDAEMTQRLHAEVEKAMAANPAPADLVRQMLSQEFRTGIMLAGLATVALLILVFSTVGGLLGGMVAVGRRRTA